MEQDQRMILSKSPSRYDFDLILRFNKHYPFCEISGEFSICHFMDDLSATSDTICNSENGHKLVIIHIDTIEHQER